MEHHARFVRMAGLNPKRPFRMSNNQGGAE